MSQTIKRTANLNAYRLLLGKLTASASAGDSGVVAQSISNPRSAPVLLKTFFSIDSSPIIYVAPATNTNVGTSTLVYVLPLMSSTTIEFIVYNNDTVRHTFVIYYLLYADKTFL